MARMTQSRLYSLLALVGLFAACAAPTRESNPTPLAEPFRVLLLGDSISIGYTPYVREALGARAHVVRPTRPPARTDEPGAPENCQGTNNGVAELDRWLATDGGDWGVIHFNFGLHDLKRVQPDTGKNSNDPAHPHQANPERYGRQLSAIVARLEATGARLVFATTTPVPDGELRPFRAPDDALAYNGIALAVMEDAGVRVNDLFAFVEAYHEPLLRPGDVHFDAAGSRLLGERVTQAILAAAGHAGQASDVEPDTAR